MMLRFPSFLLHYHDDDWPIVLNTREDRLKSPSTTDFIGENPMVEGVDPEPPPMGPLTFFEIIAWDFWEPSLVDGPSSWGSFKFSVLEDWFAEDDTECRDLLIIFCL
eukprot:scaffold7949_cov37-Cyclotella_meneghiniana.AAC.5